MITVLSLECLEALELNQCGWRKDRLHCLDSPWENGYVESFNARFRDEMLDEEIFYSLREAHLIIESWRRHYDRLQATSPGSVRASLRRMPGFATPNSTAGHAPGGAQTDHELTFNSDHPMGADHSSGHSIRSHSSGRGSGSQ